MRALEATQLALPAMIGQTNFKTLMWTVCGQLKSNQGYSCGYNFLSILI